jgi:hypothetical protein
MFDQDGGERSELCSEARRMAARLATSKAERLEEVGTADVGRAVTLVSDVAGTGAGSRRTGRCAEVSSAPR